MKVNFTIWFTVCGFDEAAAIFTIFCQLGSLMIVCTGLTQTSGACRQSVFVVAQRFLNVNFWD